MKMNLGGMTFSMPCGMITFVAEHRFHPVRKWRFDYAILKHHIAIEIEGGVFAGGRHTTGVGYKGDCEKYNEATILGWRVLRYTKEDHGKILGDVERLITGNDAPGDTAKNKCVYCGR
jgi:very-short-patch-repair endonuclease